MATSACVSPGSGSPGARVPGTVSCQNDIDRYGSDRTMPYIVAGDGSGGSIGHAGAMVREISAAATLPPARNPQLPYRICVVCLGNICRSPMAEVLLRDELRKVGLAEKVEVESAGTGD